MDLALSHPLPADALVPALPHPPGQPAGVADPGRFELLIDWPALAQWAGESPDDPEAPGSAPDAETVPLALPAPLLPALEAARFFGFDAVPCCATPTSTDQGATAGQKAPPPETAALPGQALPASENRTPGEEVFALRIEPIEALGQEKVAPTPPTNPEMEPHPGPAGPELKQKPAPIPPVEHVRAKNAENPEALENPRPAEPDTAPEANAGEQSGRDGPRSAPTPRHEEQPRPREPVPVNRTPLPVPRPEASPLPAAGNASRPENPGQVSNWRWNEVDSLRDRPAASSSQPLRNLAIQAGDGMGGRVRVQLAEHDGGIHLSVRGTDPALNHGLRQNLDMLMLRLHDTGFRAQEVPEVRHADAGDRASSDPGRHGSSSQQQDSAGRQSNGESAEQHRAGGKAGATLSASRLISFAEQLKRLDPLPEAPGLPGGAS